MPALSVALVWHMHQPWYRDDVAGQFVLPWVRRRAAKDYLHMLQVLERHPDVRVTMNMVPSLLAQLALYSEGNGADADRELCLRAAADLTAAERNFLVAGAAHDDYGRRVAILAPYVALVRSLVESGAAGADAALIRDLQVWTLLAWIDPDQIRADPELRALAGRGRGFSEEDKGIVDRAQQNLLAAVVPAYRAAVASGQVEPMTSPFFHPILPLLVDAGSARVAVPEIALPDPPLRAPEDAAEQLRRGLEDFARVIGRPAAGLWPPECAVSPASAAMIHAAGAAFALSDELVLARTLDDVDVRASGALHRPHRDESGLALVFRDALLSNLIGFSYQSMSGEAAAADLLERLEAIAGATQDGAAALVTIALDGENFKDFYEENATPFLDSLYSGLAASPSLRTTHIGAHLEEHGDALPPLPALHTGSWVGGDLRTWIGDPAHTRAWALLGATREALVAAGGGPAHPRAWDELLIAEGSDWFWWFGEHHDSGSDASWDELFRTHLRNAHTLAGLAVPDAVDEPIIDTLALGNDCAPLRSVDPVEGGESEWRSAGIAEVGAVFGAMRPPASSVARILYGAGNGRLHLRFGDTLPSFDRAVVDAAGIGTLTIDRAARSVSVALPAPGALDFSVTLDEAGRGTERVPAHGLLHVAGPAGEVGESLRVLIVAAECAPVACAGDLAGLVAATAADAAALGHEVVVVIPHHRDAGFGSRPGVRLASLSAAPGGTALTARAVQGQLGGHSVAVLSIDSPALFDRPAVYGAVDDGPRYLGFCALAAALLDATGFAPDIVHGFEWQTAALLAHLGGLPSPPATVFAAGSDAPGYVVARAALAGLVAGDPGPGEVDLLDLGRRCATVVDVMPRSGSLGDVYRDAIGRLGRRG